MADDLMNLYSKTMESGGGWKSFACLLASVAIFSCVAAQPLRAELRAWDGGHSIEQIEVTVVYFVPQDAEPLPDWRERVDL